MTFEILKQALDCVFQEQAADPLSALVCLAEQLENKPVARLMITDVEVQVRVNRWGWHTVTDVLPRGEILALLKQDRRGFKSTDDTIEVPISLTTAGSPTGIMLYETLPARLLAHVEHELTKELVGQKKAAESALALLGNTGSNSSPAQSVLDLDPILPAKMTAETLAESENMGEIVGCLVVIVRRNQAGESRGTVAVRAEINNNIEVCGGILLTAERGLKENLLTAQQAALTPIDTH